MPRNTPSYISYKLNTARATHIVMAVVATIISSYLMDDANVLGELHRYPMMSTISYGLLMRRRCNAGSLESGLRE